MAWSGVNTNFVAGTMHAIELSSLVSVMLNNIVSNSAGFAFSPDKQASAIKEIDGTNSAIVIEARGRSSSKIEADSVRSGNRYMRVWSSLDLKLPTGAIAELFAGQGFWSFAFPTADDRICLQIAVPRLCSCSELYDIIHAADPQRDSILHFAISRNLNLFDQNSSEFCIAPSLSSGISTSTQMPIGDALMTLDPICGDGVGHSLKSALLAVGVANSAGVTVSEDAAVAHFNSRSAYAFRAHLRNCATYYESVIHPEHWLPELDAMKAAAVAAAIEDPKEELTLTVGGIDRSSPTVYRDLQIQLVPRAQSKSSSNMMP